MSKQVTAENEEILREWKEKWELQGMRFQTYLRSIKNFEEDKVKAVARWARRHGLIIKDNGSLPSESMVAGMFTATEKARFKDWCKDNNVTESEFVRAAVFSVVAPDNLVVVVGGDDKRVEEVETEKKTNPYIKMTPSELVQKIRSEEMQKRTDHRMKVAG